MAKKVSASQVPDMFLKLLQHDFKGLEIVKEHKFHPVRKWRFDYAIVDLKIAVEVDGAVWVGGRHNRAAGYVADMEKLNTAAYLTGTSAFIQVYIPEESMKSYLN